MIGAKVVRRRDPGAADGRVVHALDGISDDVHVPQLHEAGDALWRMWQRHPRWQPHDVVLGLDAGGIPPAVATAAASLTPFRLAWKLHLDLPGRRVFHEPRAHRTEVSIYGDDWAGRRVLVVDDEVTTGETATGCCRVLREAGAVPVAALCLVSVGRLADLADGTPLVALTALRGSQL